ncbi:MAG: hypothetical protein IPO27_10375 [Bacteroidetes bacterium]|nr:hypothetical protein [Bacteroidota bacterium]
MRIQVKRLKFFVMLMLMAAIFVAFLSMENETSIRIKWNKAYASETEEEVITGMLWSLSLLGAELPEGCIPQVFHKKGAYEFDLHLHKAGFNTQALQALQVICDTIQNSNTYQIEKAVDIGRFLLLTIHSAHHYYQITGAPATYEEFNRRHPTHTSKRFVILASGVSKRARIVNFNIDSNPLNMAMAAWQLEDTFYNPGSKPVEYECVDIMSNSQLRFMTYDHDGDLQTASDSLYTNAGKPGKCMWCHESHFQHLFYPTPEVSGFISTKQFQQYMDSANSHLHSYRDKLKTEIKFKNKQDHTLHELLYISFMEPSLMRVSHEVNQSTSSTAMRKLNKTDKHVYEEFPFLGELFYRSFIDSCFHKDNIRVPESVREKSGFEPNYLLK